MSDSSKSKVSKGSQRAQNTQKDAKENAQESAQESAQENANEEIQKDVHRDVQEDTASTAVSTEVLEVGGGIEVGGLQANQISVLQEQHARGLIDVQRKASELKVDIQALDQTLESLTSQARSANDAGVNITATHTQNTSLGQTEIIVGNTQRAASGKVAPIWSGLENPQIRTGLMIAAAVVAGIVIAALFS